MDLVQDFKRKEEKQSEGDGQSFKPDQFDSFIKF